MCIFQAPPSPCVTLSTEQSKNNTMFKKQCSWDQGQSMYPIKVMLPWQLCVCLVRILWSRRYSASATWYYALNHSHFVDVYKLTCVCCPTDDNQYSCTPSCCWRSIVKVLVFASRKASGYLSCSWMTPCHWVSYFCHTLKPDRMHVYAMCRMSPE